MIYLSLGSNLGDRLYNLQLANKLILERCLYNGKSSIIIETKAIVKKESPSDWNKPYLNMIIGGESNLSCKELLKIIKDIETEMGRPANYEKWAPRIIDIDILLWHDLKVNTPDLIIPHPELENRPFFKHLLSLFEAESWRNNTFNKCFTGTFVLSPALVGIVNITDDSFSDGGQFNQPDKAAEKIYKLSEEGASIIEIGAQSTRPGAIIQNPKDEAKKLELVLDRLSEVINNGVIKISVDTFWTSVVNNLIHKYRVSWINDVKGDFDDETLRSIADNRCKICLMHSLTVPANPDIILPFDRKPVHVIKEWGKRSVDRLIKLGFSENDIILDPGIGFGKNVYQNIELIHSVGELKELGVAIMIGHSRKSYISAFSLENMQDRDIETIAVSLTLKDKVDFLRVHNVKDHMRFLVTHKIFE